MTYSAIYQKAIANGASPLFADLLASRQPPGVKGTERAYMEGRNNNEDLNKMNATMRKHLLTEAQAAGVSISGKTYCSGLARYANDPSAWVSGRDEVAARCRENGWECEGNVTVKQSERPEALPRIREMKAAKKRKQQHART
jgi:hypothetical protein